MEMKLARILVFLPLAMLFLSPVHATTPVLVTGNVSGDGATTTESRTADGNTFITFVIQEKFTGGIQAQGTFTVSEILHATGFFEATASGTITGTVTESSTGSVEAHAAFTGTIDTTSGNIISLQGHLTLHSGTQGLTGLHGQGTITQVQSTATYSVQIHFDP